MKSAWWLVSSQGRVSFPALWHACGLLNIHTVLPRLRPSMTEYNVRQVYFSVPNH